jgi:HPt (histidine-containing phosphotransfer) domain-containing protein
MWLTLFEEIDGLKAYVDVDSALARIRGNRKVFKMLLGTFLKDPEIEPLKQAILAGDLKEAASLAHKVKGVSANLSLIALNKEIVAIESSLKAGQSVSGDELNSLDATLGKTVDYINRLAAVLE